MNLEIFTLEGSLYGEKFENEALLHKYFRKRCDNHLKETRQKLYCICQYSAHGNAFYFAAHDKSFLESPQAAVALELLSGPYGTTNEKNMDEFYGLLFQSSHRVNHENLTTLKVFDPSTGRVSTSLLLRDDGLDLNTLAKLATDQSQEFRNRYIHTFASSDSPCIERYLHPKPLPHGDLDLPYLWDCIPFAEANMVTGKQLLDYSSRLGEVLFFWDAHPSIPYLHSLGRSNIYQMECSQLLEHYFRRNFCEDLYIFDSSLAWTLILTHEPLNADNDKFVLIGKVPREGT